MDDTIINTAVAEDVVLHAKAFLGSVFGEYLREVRTSGTKYTPSIMIHLKMDMMFAQPFLNVLSLKYKLKQITNAFETIYSIEANNQERATMKLSFHEPGLIKNTYVFFDVDALEEDSRSLHVSVYFPGVFDPLTMVKTRIKSKCFTIVPFYAKHPKASVHMHVENAIQLVKNGWTMDTHMQTTDIWTVNYWKESAADSSASNSTCSLCHEDYKDGDIVFTTSCGHRFHWLCSQGQGGLKHWCTTCNKMQCPLCRKYMF